MITIFGIAILSKKELSDMQEENKRLWELMHKRQHPKRKEKHGMRDMKTGRFCRADL